MNQASSECHHKALILNFKMPVGWPMSAVEYSLKMSCDIEAPSTRFGNSSTEIPRHLCVGQPSYPTPMSGLDAPSVFRPFSVIPVNISYLSEPSQWVATLRVSSTQHLTQNMASSRCPISLGWWRGKQSSSGPFRKRNYFQQVNSLWFLSSNNVCDSACHRVLKLNEFNFN